MVHHVRRWSSYLGMWWEGYSTAKTLPIAVFGASHPWGGIEIADWLARPCKHCHCSVAITVHRASVRWQCLAVFFARRKMAQRQCLRRVAVTPRGGQ